MIYRVVLDDTIDLHTSDINCMLLNPSLDLEMNSAGSFNFTLPPSHPYWDSIKVLKSTIDVYEDGDLIFTGRIASIEKNWNNERVVQCEGALAYFNDSIHRQMKWETPLPIASEDPTVHNFLKDILDNHNVFEGAENANRHIFIGNITVDPEVVTREVNYDTTLDILTRMCIDTNGGYMSVRKDLNDGKLYLDWIKDFTEESGQPAQFGLNLLNFDTSLAAEDICTGVLARGAEVNEQTVMLNNVELVDETTYPDMSVTHYTDKYQDILWHREGVEKFGQVVQVHDFSDAQTAWKDGQGQIVANSLFEMAKKWLEEKNTKIETIEVEVAELAWLGEGMPKYKLGQIVELSDNVHMADESYETRLLPMYKLSCDLNSGSKKVTLGTPPKKELTQISASNSDSSTLSSSGSSSGGGGSGEGEECRVHDVRVDGTSVVTNKIANISLAGKADVSTVNALATTVAGKADTSTVNALATVVASKQDQIEFNTLEAATEVLTRLKADNKVYNLGGGTEVEANPSETATDDLNTIKIGETVYDIPGSGGSTNYGKFKCDELFVNNPLPSPTSGTSDVNKTYTLNHSIDDYDAVVVEIYGIYFLNDSSNPRQKVTVLVMKNDYYENTQSTEAFRTGSPHHNQLRVLDFDFSNSTTINTNAHRTDSGNEPILYKVYGLKFENKLINRSDIYSEEERMIGRWTDGKPLYQKVITIPNFPNNNRVEYQHNIANVDTIFVAGGFGTDSNSGTTSPLTLANSTTAGQWHTNVNKTVVGIWAGSDRRSINIVKVILNYTKTTDTTNSGFLPEDPQMVMMSDYYSEDEQVVGRWTDGKPLYQKTIVLEDVAMPNAYTEYELADLSSLNIEYNVKIFAIWSNSTHTLEYIVPYVANYDGSPTKIASIVYKTDTKKLIAFANNTTFSAADIKVTLQYTKTTDAPGTGPTKGNLIYLPALYSEEEREVGVWKDGKPLYQKSWDFGSNVSISSGNYYTGFNIDSSNIDKIIFGEIANNDGTLYDNASYDPTRDNHTLLGIKPDNSCNVRYLTLQYTKIADQPGSGTWTPEGQLAHHYSTSEKIVGTWIDGSTVYERTWDFSANPISLPYDTWINTTIQSSDGVSRIISAKCLTSGFLVMDGNEIVVGAANYPVAICAKINHGRSLGYLTLQYTKSS